LVCSPEHLVLRQEPAEWVRVGDLRQSDRIVVECGTAYVDSVDPVDSVERLCDVQVSIAHSYLADGVLSHNSHFLTMLGCNALRAGKNVLHYTMELSETMTGVRYDSNLCAIDADDVIDSKDNVLNKYQEMKGMGRLIIKYYPTMTPTIHTLRAHIEKLSVKGFKPDILIIDYADILRSTRQYESLRHELKLIYQELRGYASELGVPIWTASQSNKEGSNSDIIDLGNMSEAYGKAMEADFVLGLSRKAHEKATPWGRLYVAKNRFGRDGLVYPIKINTAQSRFEIAGEQGTLDEAQNPNDDAALRKALRDRMSELSKDAALHGKKHDVDSLHDVQ
jgi:hypothetical protein